MFSIIIPVYNADQFIERTIKSILKQSYPLFEIIVVNDGSTDQTEKILIDLGSKDSRIRYFNQENLKQGAARNNGLKHANNDYVLFIDSDDTISGRLLEKLHEKIEERYYDIIFYNHIKDYGNKKTLIEFDASIIEKINYQNNERLIGVASPCLAAYKRDFLINNNIQFLENIFFEDISFMVDTMFYAKSASFIKEESYSYRILEDSTVRSKNPMVNLDVIKNLEHINRYMEQESDLFDIVSFIATKYLLFEGSVRVIDNSTSYQLSYNIIQEMRSFYIKSNYQINTKYYKKMSLLEKLPVLLVNFNMIRTLKFINTIRRSLEIWKGKMYD